MPPLITRQTPTHAEHTLTLSHTLPNTHSADRQINWITGAATATTTKKKQRKQQNQISGDKTGFRVKSPPAVSPQQQEKKNLNTAKPNKTAKNRKKPKKNEAAAWFGIQHKSESCRSQQLWLMQRMPNEAPNCSKYSGKYSAFSSQPQHARVQLGLQKILLVAWRSCLLDNLVHKLKCHKSNSHKALNQTLNALLVEKGRLNWPLELPSHAPDQTTRCCMLNYVHTLSHSRPRADRDSSMWCSFGVRQLRRRRLHVRFNAVVGTT